MPRHIAIGVAGRQSVGVAIDHFDELTVVAIPEKVLDPTAFDRLGDIHITRMMVSTIALPLTRRHNTKIFTTLLNRSEPLPRGVDKAFINLGKI